MRPELSLPSAQPHDTAREGRWIRPYYPAFDGLRAVAVLAVFFDHYGPMASPRIHSWFTWTGVDLFFVLSGFLITGILYDTRHSERFFRVFYARRMLRILPLYYSIFLLILVLTPVFHLEYHRTLWTHVIYISNLITPAALLGRWGDPTVLWAHVHARALFIQLGIFWSLAVEEQFYILWPLVVWMAASRRALMWLCGVMIALTVSLRVFLYFDSSAALLQTHYLYYSTYTRCDTLLLGAWLALWLRGSRIDRQALRRIGGSAILTGVAALAVLLMTVGRRWPLDAYNPVLQTVGYTLIALAAGGVLLYCLDETSVLHRALLSPPLARLGRISYGFYLLHELPLHFFASVTKRALMPHHLGILILPIAFGCSAAAAHLSFRFLESPFLRLKRFFPTDHRSIPTGAEEI